MYRIKIYCKGSCRITCMTLYSIEQTVPVIIFPDYGSVVIMTGSTIKPSSCVPGPTIGVSDGEAE